MGFPLLCDVYIGVFVAAGSDGLVLDRGLRGFFDLTRKRIKLPLCPLKLLTIMLVIPRPWLLNQKPNLQLQVLPKALPFYPFDMLLQLRVDFIQNVTHLDRCRSWAFSTCLLYIRDFPPNISTCGAMHVLFYLFNSIIILSRTDSLVFYVGFKSFILGDGLLVGFLCEAGIDIVVLVR